MPALNTAVKTAAAEATSLVCEQFAVTSTNAEKESRDRDTPLSFWPID